MAATTLTVLQPIGGGALAGSSSEPLVEPGVTFPRLGTVGPVVLKRLMTPDAAHSLAQDLVSQKARNELAPDSGVPGAWSSYADPIFQILLLRAQPIVEQVIAADLHPTYSYARVYVRGNDLPPHVDREACEVSVSMALGADRGHVWPFWVEFDGLRHEVRLSPGDAVLYLGHETRHWRTALEAEWSAHVFLHYVFQDGPWADFKFDQRPS